MNERVWTKFQQVRSNCFNKLFLFRYLAACHQPSCLGNEVTPLLMGRYFCCFHEYHCHHDPQRGSATSSFFQYDSAHLPTCRQTAGSEASRISLAAMLSILTDGISRRFW
ncbi:unnamed protein product [Protopolystoma xenopodis]|uniref:Uncharacterized protein n=1 Tax=Protopolystoma xenopodis TaxID=117903 RepID=A0A3S5BL17_9PLAT|nr:unnamed protein product [Protopolystoma xenopodis]